MPLNLSKIIKNKNFSPKWPAIYAIGIDVKEKPRLALYVILYKVFFTYLLETIKIFSQLEEFMKYPMKWEIAQRRGGTKTDSRNEGKSSVS